MNVPLKRLFASLLVVSLLVTGGAAVHAQEITPDSSSYDYGATSEYAVSRTIGEAASDEALADTGDSSVAVLSAGLLLVGGASLFAMYKQKRLAK